MAVNRITSKAGIHEIAKHGARDDDNDFSDGEDLKDLIMYLWT
jgi:hypothetical protein